VLRKYFSTHAEIFIQKHNDHKVSQLTSLSTNYYAFHRIKDSLLVRRNAFLVLDLGLDILNAVAGFNLKSDSLSCQGLDKDLHTTSQTQYQVEGRLLLNVVVTEGTTILQLLSSED